MPEEVGQEFTTEVEDNSQTTEAEVTATENEGGYNPAWEPLRQSLGLQFESIKPELAKIDKDFHSHIEKVNGQYAPWKGFVEQGVTPEQVTQSFQMLQKLNDNPEEVYQALGEFLQQTGRLPTPAEVQEAVEQVPDDENVSEDSRKIAELQKQLDDLKSLQEAQHQQDEQARMQEKADNEVQQEYDAFQKAHPDLSPEDWREIQMRHYTYALQGAQFVKSLEDVGKEYFDMVDRIRQTPRPNDLAPRLPGAGGAAPAPQQKDPSQFSRNESVDALTEMLIRSKQS